MEDSRALQQLASAISEELTTTFPDSPSYRRNLSVTYGRMADLASGAGEVEEARTLLQQALAIQETLAAAAPDNAHHQVDLAITYERLGSLATDSPAGAAASWFALAVGHRRRLYEQKPSSVQLAESLAASLMFLAQTQSDPSQARAEIIRVLAPFAPGKSLTRKGLILMRWARSDVGA